MKFTFMTLVALVAVVAADEHTISNLQQIRQATSAFEQAMSSWDGSYNNGIPLVKQFYGLYSTLMAANAPPPALTKYEADFAASNYTAMHDEAFSIAQDLVGDVGAAVDAAISLKPKIEAIPVVGSYATSMLFSTLRSTASTLGGVIGAQATDDRAGEAQDIVQQIDNHFVRGMNAFQ
ncbi:hypothetical protein BX600DRAFT_443990 [Xylariales sp. PMI_506]|nr:hypothetical protein BX600DRAFT_443990 [Xylariales sp. PMI_506]